MSEKIDEILFQANARVTTLVGMLETSLVYMEALASSMPDFAKLRREIVRAKDAINSYAEPIEVSMPDLLVAPAEGDEDDDEDMEDES